MELEFAGVKFKNPFVVASSPLTSKIELLKKAEDHGAAAVSTKLTFIKQPFYGKLRMYNSPNEASIICYDRRLDLEEGLELVRQAKEQTELKIFVNITSDSGDLESWQRLAREHEEAGADLIEANLICPNVGLATKSIKGADAVSNTEHGGAVTGQDPVLVKRVVSALKAAVKIPVVAKLTPNVTDIAVIARACQEAGADGVCLAGGQSSLPPVDIYHEGRPCYELLNGASHGSLGGPATKLLSFSQVAQVAMKTNLPIIGGGGLGNAEDAIMMMMWGATLVTYCTSIMWYGWDVVRRTVAGIEKYMQDMGYSDYRQIIGKSLQYLRPSSELEAVPGYPRIAPDKCNGCGRCALPGHCQAITIINHKAVVQAEKCLGCGICKQLCTRKAISF
ncbi:MAG: hypothetical protein IMW95_12135 [Moorella humiferrea]|nr:hypothetical protein [Moorella humiferrea]